MADGLNSATSSYQALMARPHWMRVSKLLWKLMKRFCPTPNLAESAHKTLELSLSGRNGPYKLIYSYNKHKERYADVQ